MGWAMVFLARLREFAAWDNGTATLGIRPATLATITAAQAAAGTTYPVSVRLQDADGNALQWASFTLAASIGDTVSDGGTVPTIDDATPTLNQGEVIITVTVTIANFTAPDGRTLTGGTSVLTIAA